MIRWMVRDEREATVDAAADRLSYLVVSFGLLAVVAVRSFVHREASWDLLALVIVSGLVGTAVRAQRRVVTRRWLVVLAVTAAVAALVAAITLLTTRA
jgi:hypothetical protein